MRNVNTLCQCGLLLSILLLLASSSGGQTQGAGVSANDKSSNRSPGHPVIRINVKFPPEVLKSLDLTPDQARQVEQVPRPYEQTMVVDMDRIGQSYYKLEQAVLADNVDDALVGQRMQEFLASYATQIKTKVNMLKDLRGVLNSDQLARLRPQLPLEKIGNQVSVRMPDSLPLITLTSEQSAQLQDISSRYGKLMEPVGLRKKEAHLALEQAILAEQLDQSLIEQRFQEFVAPFKDEIKINTDLLGALRSALTPPQLASLRESEQRLAAGELLDIPGRSDNAKLGSPVYTAEASSGGNKVKSKVKAKD